MTKIKAGIATLLLVATTLLGLVLMAEPSSATGVSVTITVDVEVNADLRPEADPHPDGGGHMMR